ARHSSSHRRRLAWALPLLAAVLVGARLLAQAGTPDVQVLNGTGVVSPGGTVAFGTTPVGVAASRTFTVQNTGTDSLLLSEAVTVPVGFTLMASSPGAPNAVLPATGAPAYTIAPNATATFTVALNSATAGKFSGQVSFQTNVDGKNPFVFRVNGTALPPPGVRYLDDTDAGFTFSPRWTQNY